MSKQTIGIYSGRNLAAELRAACPEILFVTGSPERDMCRIAIIDSDSMDAINPPPRKSIVRIILEAKSQQQPRRQGELRIERSAFLARPREHLAFASDLMEAVGHASQLETEVTYLTQIHELMTMSDAQAVSERITRTVMDLLGLTRGTLFLHDPRLERYVVSFSNDPNARETGEFLPGIPPDLLQRALASGHSFASDGGMGLVVMPLQVEHDLVGVICAPMEGTDTFDAAIIENVSRYLGAVATVLGNIYQLSRSRDLAMPHVITKP